MKPREPLPLYHSWPLFEYERYLEPEHLPQCNASMMASTLSASDGHELASEGIGLWECDLSNNHLTWSAGVFDIFGLPREAHVVRDDIVRLYVDESRLVMERLRAYAIRHRRGFTVDVEIRPSQTTRCWMRLIAAPVCEGRKVTHLRGIKHLI